MMSYTLTATDVVLRNSDRAAIPNDPGNRHRIEYEAWLVEGNVPDPYVPPEQPPEPTLKDKLDTLGIPLADLKAALEALQ
jgi:hypothetical protein